MKFLIRDDDTCAFTTPAELEQCYGHIWETVPAGLSVTPFRVAGGEHVFPGHEQAGDERRPLETNPELVAFLRGSQEAGRVEILMHGYEHTRPRGLPEYIGGKDLVRKTREGKEYLETLLECRIDTFVPPYNGIMRNGFDAVVAAGLNLVGMPSLVRSAYRPVGARSLAGFLKVRFYRAAKGMVYPHVLDLGDHKELAYHSITPSQSMTELIDGFDRCRAEDGIFVAATHYHAFDDQLSSGETLRQALDVLLDRAAGVTGVQYPTFGELWSSA